MSFPISSPGWSISKRLRHRKRGEILLSLLCCCNRASYYIVSSRFLSKVSHSVPGAEYGAEVREGSWEPRKRTVDRQLAVSNNLLDLSLLLQIGKTSPREGTIDL
jgi:hypothetical protein